MEAHRLECTATFKEVHSDLLTRHDERIIELQDDIEDIKKSIKDEVSLIWKEIGDVKKKLDSMLYKIVFANTVSLASIVALIKYLGLAGK